MPECGRPDIDAHNSAVWLLEGLRPQIESDIDWSSGGIDNCRLGGSPRAGQDGSSYIPACQIKSAKQHKNDNDDQDGAELKKWLHYPARGIVQPLL